MEKELVLCDTNILISWFKGEAKTLIQLEDIGLDNILIPSVALMEIYQGVRNKAELLQIKKKLNAYHIIHFNDAISKIAIDLIEKFRLSHGLLIPDAIIAATAITIKRKLFTYNTKDFKYISGVTLF